MLEISFKESLKMNFTTVFGKKIKKGQKRLQKVFSMKNHFGK